MDLDATAGINPSREYVDQKRAELIANSFRDSEVQELKRRFEAFCGSAFPAEIHYMSEVMNRWEMERDGNTDNNALFIALAQNLPESLSVKKEFARVLR